MPEVVERMVAAAVVGCHDLPRPAEQVGRSGRVPIRRGRGTESRFDGSGGDGMRAEIHSLVGAYALDAVDDLERAVFDGHLRGCEPCRDEVAGLREATARLAGGAWSVPPPSFKPGVLAEVATTRQVAPPLSARLRRSGSLRLRQIAAAAAQVAATTAGTAVFVVQEARVRHEQALALSGSVLSASDLLVRHEP